MKIYIHKDGQQLGPYSIEETYSYLQEGRLLQADFAWHEGTADWKPLSDVLGIRPTSQPPPPKEQSQTFSTPASKQVVIDSLRASPSPVPNSDLTDMSDPFAAHVQFICEKLFVMNSLYKLDIYCDEHLAKQGVRFGEKPFLIIPAGAHTFKARSRCGPFSSTSDEITLVLPPGAKEIINIEFNATNTGLSLTTTSKPVTVKPNYWTWVLAALAFGVLLLKLFRYSKMLH